MHFGTFFAVQRGPHRKKPRAPRMIAPLASASSGLTARQRCGAFCIDQEQARHRSLAFFINSKPRQSQRRYCARAG
jgi:hypothetical protein